MKTTLDAIAAFRRLRDGNQRFAAGLRSIDTMATHTKRAELTSGQTPFAIILGCSDSRVPAEIIFDQGLGDLFVIRVAGNVVAPSQIGSVEFAAAEFDIRLVVVLGHSQCGAVSASISALRHPDEEHSLNIRSIVDRIRPAIAGLMSTELRDQPAALLQQAVRANVRASVNQMRHGSVMLEDLTNHGGLLIVGAEYSLETGVVDFFDGIPESG
ncbi:MAG: carbonic anhydrase [Thiohalobacteraceae bacterium]